MPTTSPRPRRSLVDLPGEVWDHVLAFVPRHQLRSTALGLLEALPGSQVSVVHLFRHIAISDDKQLRSLLETLSLGGHALAESAKTRSLASSSGRNSFAQIDITEIPQTFALRSWRLVDNNVLINVLNILSRNLRVIDLHIGPMFGPDQLEDLFLAPKPKLEILSLRFNQNVSKRSYEPFLKGAYFDNCCDLLAKWPLSPSFRSLCFVQDLPPPLQKSTLLNEGIAQPIILFRFCCITNLAASPIGFHLSNLRLRIPGRNLSAPLTTAPSPQTSSLNLRAASFGVPMPMFPNLRYLDISTSVLPTVLTGLLPILKTYINLQHLVLDRTQLIIPSRFQGDEERVQETIRAIGNTVASAGLYRAKDVSRLWQEFRRLTLVELQNHKLRASDVRGQGLKDTLVAQELLASPIQSCRSRRRGRSSYASAPRWGKEESVPRPSTCRLSSLQTELTGGHSPEELILPDHVVVFPAASSLLSISCGTELSDDHDSRSVREAWQDQFRIGWETGRDRFGLSVSEKLLEWNRATDAWTKSLASRQPELDPDDLSRFHQTRPRMMKLATTTFCNNKFYEAVSWRNFEDFMRHLCLVETSPAEIQHELMELRSRSCPTFCTFPDCPSIGKVGWIPLQSASSGLLSSSTMDDIESLTASKRDSMEISDQLGRIKLGCPHPRADLASRDPHEGFHARGCGHLVGRQLWEALS